METLAQAVIDYNTFVKWLFLANNTKSHNLFVPPSCEQWSMAGSKPKGPMYIKTLAQAVFDYAICVKRLVLVKNTKLHNLFVLPSCEQWSMAGSKQKEPL